MKTNVGAGLLAIQAPRFPSHTRVTPSQASQLLQLIYAMFLKVITEPRVVERPFRRGRRQVAVLLARGLAQAGVEVVGLAVEQVVHAYRDAQLLIERVVHVEVGGPLRAEGLVVLGVGGVGGIFAVFAVAGFVEGDGPLVELVYRAGRGVLLHAAQL